MLWRAVHAAWTDMLWRAVHAAWTDMLWRAVHAAVCSYRGRTASIQCCRHSHIHTHAPSHTTTHSLFIHSITHSLTHSLTFRRLFMIHLWCLFRKVQSDYLNWFRRLYENCDIQVVESFVCPEASLCKIRKRCWSLMQCIIREPQGILDEGFLYLISSC